MAKIDNLSNSRQPGRRALSAADAKNRFADVLRQAESGEVVVITRYGKPAAALVGAERLARWEGSGDGAAESPGPQAREPGAGVAPAVPQPPPPVRAVRSRSRQEATPEELRQRAAAASLRRIEADLARLPERLRPVLRLIRGSLFQPRLTVRRVQSALGVGAHDATTEFRRVTGAPIRRYLEDRRLECAARLLVDTDLDVGTIGRLVGYSHAEALSRAFRRRYGVRPPIYRELGGRLSPVVASDAGADLPPAVPRFLAGFAALAPGARCERCGDGLEPAPALRVFDDLAPLCDACAREHAPELRGLLEPAADG